MYGTIVEYGGSKYVRLDGSDLLTPYTATVAAKAGERVRVSVGKHTATVTGNVSSPAARSGDVDDLNAKVESFDTIVANKANIRDLEAEHARINDLVADNVVIKKQLTADSADIKDLKTDNLEVKNTLKANNAEIDQLKANKIDASTVSANYATIKNLTAATGRIDNLESQNANIKNLVAEKADIDLANVENAFISKGVLKDGSIGTAAIHEGAITNSRIADATIEAAKIKTINADSITTGTLKTNRLIITGPDGRDSIVKAINIANGVSEAEVNGQKIQAASIDVVDLSAFQAKIAQFDMSQNAIYSGKTSIKDPNSGVYISTTGLGLGDGALTSKKESPIQMYADGVFKLRGKNSSLEFNPVTDDLDINVSNFRIGSKEAATSDDVSAVEDKINNLKIGGRNLLKGTHKNAVTCTYPTGTGYIDKSSWETTIPLNGDTYTLSFWAKSTVADDKIVVYFYAPSNIISVKSSQGYSSTALDGRCPFTLSTALTKYWVTYVIPKGGDATRHVIIPRLYGPDRPEAEKGSGVITIQWEKLEEGNTATDWTPAPEDSLESVDVEYYLSTSATSLSGGSWSTTAPAWVNGKYMWSRTVKIDGSGNKTYSPSENGVCIAGAKGETGPQGPQGVQGVKGADGQTYYTWLKYADSPTSGMSDNPSGKKYIGLAYNKTTSTESTSYSDYTWSLIKGEVGATGNGIKSITYYYARTTSQTAPAAGNITATTMPALDATNKYLWQKEVITYTNNTTQTTVLLLAVYGNTGSTGAKGDKGATGTGIKSVVEQYYKSTSNTTQTGGSWTTTYPGWENGKYIWTRSVITYTDNTSTTTTPICVTGSQGNTGAKGEQGNTGPQGVSVTNIKDQWYKSTSNTTQTGGSWTDSQPNWESGKYIWTRSYITFSNGTTTTTNPVLASAINSANANAANAVSKVDNLSVGGRNLVLNSYKLNDNFFGAGGYVATTTVVTDTEALSKYHIESKCTTAGSGPHFPIFSKTADKIGKTYTWSFWAKCSVAKSGSVGHECGGQKNISLTTSWQKFSYTWKFIDGQYSSFTFYLNFKVGEILYIRDFKIEEGNQATSWTPAPEDVDSKVSAANTNASTALSTANTAKSTADSAKSTASNAASTANTAKSSVDALSKITTKSYSVTGASGKVKWVRLGTLTSAGDSSVAVITLRTGDGYNGQARQNAQAEILIKDGWQQTASTTSAFGVSVTRQNTQTVDGNGAVTDHLLVSVRATASNVCEVWVYLDWTYWNGTYTISGIYNNWNPNTANQDAKPTNGVEQDLAYRTTAEDAYRKAENTEKTVVAHSEFIKKSETWQMNWTNIISIDNVAVDKYQKYITFDNGTILLGHSKASSKVKITNDSIQFKGTSTTVVTPDSDATAWITGKVFHINSGEIESSLKFGKVYMKPDNANNALVIRDPDNTYDAAKFGSTVTIGKPSGRNVTIGDSGLGVRNGFDVIAQIAYGATKNKDNKDDISPYYTMGYRTIGHSNGYYSFAEGYNVVAAGHISHAEGCLAKATGSYSHAEGWDTKASGDFSHAEGCSTASGDYSHAECLGSIASGYASHAGGNATIAAGNSQTAIGRCNIEDKNDTYAFIIGNGVSQGVTNPIRSNALTVDWSGNITAPKLTSPGALNLGFNGGNAFHPYFTKNDSISGLIITSGYVTNGSTYVDFVVPLSKPVVGATGVSVASVGGLVIRQGGKYLFGSSASAYVKPSSYDATLTMGGNAVNVVAKMPNTTNVVSNNDACGIYAKIKLTFA